MPGVVFFGIARVADIRLTKRSQDTISVLSEKMMTRHLDVVHWTLGTLRHFQAFSNPQQNTALKPGPPRTVATTLKSASRAQTVEQVVLSSSLPN
jgi:hypothetical protein